MKYDFSAIEKKWQEKWQKEKTYQTKNFVKGKPKFYGLVEFPYPSGAGSPRRPPPSLHRNGRHRPKEADGRLQCPVPHRV